MYVPEPRTEEHTIVEEEGDDEVDLISHGSLLIESCCQLFYKVTIHVVPRDGEVPQITTSPPVHQSSFAEDLPVQSSPQI